MSDAERAARLEANRREGYLSHADIWRACPYQAEFGECIYPRCGLRCKGRLVDRREAARAAPLLNGFTRQPPFAPIVKQLRNRHL